MVRKGDSGERVEVLQSRLGLRVDGVYGPHTEQAVKDLQYHTACTVDGVYGPQTAAALSAWKPDPVMSRAIAYLGWGYAVMGTNRTRFARDVPMIPRDWVPQVVRGPWNPTGAAVDCITFAAGVVAACFPSKLGPDAYTDMMLWKGSGPWANIEAMVMVGAGEEVEDPVAGCWHLWQGWRRYPQSGHCGLAYGTGGDTAQVLESAQRWGPSWRGIGPLRSMVRPQPSLIWAAVDGDYAGGLRLVKLNLG